MEKPMSTVKELRRAQVALAAQARAKFDEITDATPTERAAEIEREFDAMMAEHDKIGARIERAEKLETIEARANTGDGRRPHYAADDERDADKGETLDYRTAFREMLRNGGNAAELSPELRQILRAGVVPAKDLRAQTTSNTAGGYTVPVTLANFIVKSMAAWGPMYDENICTTITTSSGEQINIPTIDDTTTAAAKTAEGVALTDDGGVDVTVGQKVLNAFLYDSEFIRWSIELMQDSDWDWEQLLGELIGERLGRRANTELTTGDGSGDPNGIVVASSLGVTAASATALTADELIDLQHSVNPAYRQSPKARFMFSDSTLKVIRKLKDGEGNYLWNGGDLSKGISGTLLGQPYSINQAMASVATGNKSVIYGDFGKYFVRKVGRPIIGVMRERFWPSLGIAGLIRIDGELGDTAAVKHLIQA
jgi:HK97 family phage major capsid protein